MIANRSVPTATVIPELPYDDVAQASDHRAQLVFGDGAVILTARGAQGHGAVLMRVADAEGGTLR